VITRKEFARSAKTLGTLRICWHANAQRFSKSFGGRLAQIRATEAFDPARRAWSSAEEFDWGKEPESDDAPLQVQSDKRAPSPRAGRGRGEWGQVVFGKAVR
jgi:hypothetical protein